MKDLTTIATNITTALNEQNVAITNMILSLENYRRYNEQALKDLEKAL